LEHPQPERPDHQSGGEVAQHRAQPQALGQRRRDNRAGEQDDDRQQVDAVVCGFHGAGLRRKSRHSRTHGRGPLCPLACRIDPATFPGSPMKSVLLRSTLAIAMSLGLAACDRGAEAPTAATAAVAPTAEQVKAESARLNAWFETQYEEQLQFSPIQLSFLGRKDLRSEEHTSELQ